MKKRLGEGKSVLLAVRVPEEWMEKLRGMADEANPVRELVRDALRRFLRLGDG